MTDAPAEACWIATPRVAEIRSQPELGTGDAVVRTLHSGVSRGTESLVFRGEVPASEHATMRAPFQEGDFDGAVKYGYSNVGIVESGPEHLRGKTVFCLYPHQTRYRVPASALVEVPARVPARRAILAANLETAVNALWDAAPRVGDAIAVIGAGAVGCLVAWLAARIPGCTVELADVNPSRAQIADALGVAFRAPAALRADNDLVFHTSASAEGLERALEVAGVEARVMELSWYGNRAVSIPLGAAFHSRRIELVSSQVGRVSPARRARRDHRERLTLALRLLDDSRLDALINSESTFHELPQILARLAAGRDDTVCHCVNYI